MSPQQRWLCCDNYLFFWVVPSLQQGLRSKRCALRRSRRKVHSREEREREVESEEQCEMFTFLHITTLAHTCTLTLTSCAQNSYHAARLGKRTPCSDLCSLAHALQFIFRYLPLRARSNIIHTTSSPSSCSLNETPLSLFLLPCAVLLCAVPSPRVSPIQLFLKFHFPPLWIRRSTDMLTPETTLFSL